MGRGGIHHADIGAVAGYIAGGGLAGVFAALNIFYPEHVSQINGLAIALVACAGLAHVIYNPTPLKGTSAVVTSAVPPTPDSLSANTPIAAPKEP